jgi:hypothetical protein
MWVDVVSSSSSPKTHHIFVRGAEKRNGGKKRERERKQSEGENWC